MAMLGRSPCPCSHLKFERSTKAASKNPPCSPTLEHRAPQALGFSPRVEQRERSDARAGLGPNEGLLKYEVHRQNEARAESLCSLSRDPRSCRGDPRCAGLPALRQQRVLLKVGEGFDRKVTGCNIRGGIILCNWRRAQPGCLQVRNALSETDPVTSPELDAVTPLEDAEDLSQATLIWRAIKLPIYSVALIPLTVGAAAACLHSGVFNWGRYWLLLGSSVLVITWLNLSNDAYDAETGVDKDKKESVVNMTGSQEGVLAAAYACLALGFTGLVRAAQQAGDMRVTGLLAAAILCGYIYQCPPFRLSYKGLGEPLCFMAFGPFATTAFYLCQASGVGALPVTLTVVGASFLVGITTSLILFCSHFHQIDGDLSVGKMSPLVRLGTEKGSKIVQTAVVSLYALIAVLTAVKALPLTCSFFSLLTLPIARLVLQFISKNHANKSLIFMAKYYCVRLHVALGAALILGLLSAPMLPAAATFW